MYVWRNIEVRSFYQCCSGKAISITYSVCVFVAVGIQHAKRMRHIVHLWPVRHYKIIPHYLIKVTILEKKCYWTQNVFWLLEKKIIEHKNVCFDF